MTDCLFCKIAAGEIPSAQVFENDHVLAFLDINPASPYHTLVIPKNHYVNIFDVPEEELKELINAVKKIAKLYQTKLGIQHMQIINNSGAEAQQEVPHIHFHIVPRAAGDEQDIIWKKHPELQEQFKEMLSTLNKEG